MIFVLCVYLQQRRVVADRLALAPTGTTATARVGVFAE